MMLKKHWMDFKSDTIDPIAEDLAKGGIIEVKSIGNQVVYTMNDETAQMYSEFFRSRGVKK